MKKQLLKIIIISIVISFIIIPSVLLGLSNATDDCSYNVKRFVAFLGDTGAWTADQLKLFQYSADYENPDVIGSFIYIPLVNLIYIFPIVLLSNYIYKKYILNLFIKLLTKIKVVGRFILIFFIIFISNWIYSFIFTALLPSFKLSEKICEIFFIIYIFLGKIVIPPSGYIYDHYHFEMIDLGFYVPLINTIFVMIIVFIICIIKHISFFPKSK